jgi:radical SAM superfamily enzyme YgiQ (UPF0313 family)
LRASADELRMQGYRVEPTTAFLADSNAVITRTSDLVDIISYLLATFPSLERVTSYARAKTILAKELDELVRLREAGLDRLHVGLESGDDGVLARVKKGATAREMIDAGRKAKAAGFELSLYVMPGLGGRARSPDHVKGTVDVLNAVDPDFIRVRPLQVTPGTPLFDELVAGEFDPMSLVEMLEELRHIVAGLHTTGNICFDHFMNAPIFDQSWEGYRLPESKEHLLTIMDEALSSAIGRG